MLGAGVRRAEEWLDKSTGREASWALRLRSLLVDGRTDSAQAAGWPWFPDSGSWVTPTCFGVLALEKRSRVLGSAQPQQRCAAGREYLLTHRCRDGGWNHGSTRALGYDSDSYPETTGQALLALHDAPRERIASGIEKARAHVGQCRSVEALSWLRLGLSAHGEAVVDVPVLHGHGSVPEHALTLISEAAVNGRNVFLE
jgi:hypothetical protein